MCVIRYGIIEQDCPSTLLQWWMYVHRVRFLQQVWNAFLLEFSNVSVVTRHLLNLTLRASHRNLKELSDLKSWLHGWSRWNKRSKSDVTSQRRICGSKGQFNSPNLVISPLEWSNLGMSIRISNRFAVLIRPLILVLGIIRGGPPLLCSQYDLPNHYGKPYWV